LGTSLIGFSMTSLRYGIWLPIMNLAGGVFFIVVALAYLAGSRWALRYVRWWWGVDGKIKMLRGEANQPEDP